MLFSTRFGRLWAIALLRSRLTATYCTPYGMAPRWRQDGSKMLPEGLLGVSWGALGASWGRLGASWGPLGGLLGASWGPLGASWGPLGGLLGPLGGLLGASWFLLGASRGRGLEMSVLVPRPGTLLEPSWGPLGPSWRRLGPSLGPPSQPVCSKGFSRSPQRLRCRGLSPKRRGALRPPRSCGPPPRRRRRTDARGPAQSGRPGARSWWRFRAAV